MALFLLGPLSLGASDPLPLSPAVQEQPEAPDEEDAPEEAIGGALRAAGEPVEGVVLRAYRNDEIVGRATSGPDGRWLIALPAPGTYRIELDEGTLPEDVALRDPERVSLEVRVLSGQRRTVIFALGEDPAVARRVLRRLAQPMANGLKLGLIIAMTSVGLSLIFGTTRLINFAHGDMVTFGAIAAFFLNTTGPRLHLIPAAALAIMIGGGLGAGLELGLWRPLRKRKTGLFQLFVITIGLALVIRHILLIAFGGGSARYVDYALQRTMSLGPFRMTPRDLTIMALSLAILVGVALLLQKTRIGKAMRAVSDNRELAESSGIDVQRVILIIWMLGGALAAAGGIFLGTIDAIRYLMGFQLLLLMFAAVILGGIGTAYGAMAGGIVVGIVVEVSVIWFPADLKFMWALIALIAILLVRPQGIFGQRERIG